jgi:hypothetical protein
MIRPVVTALALVAALALPAAGQASDGKLIDLSLAHMNSTKRVANCVGVNGCITAIADNLARIRPLTARASERFDASGTPACNVAVTNYVREGQKLLAAAGRFRAVGGSTATRDAYFNQAVRFDATLNPLVRVC